MKLNTLLRAALLILASFLSAIAGDRYIVRVNSANPPDMSSLAVRYGGTLAKAIPNAERNLYVIDFPSNGLSGFHAYVLSLDRSVESVEKDDSVGLPLRNRKPQSFPTAPTVPPLKDANRQFNFFGAVAWGSYVNQPAGALIRLGGSRSFATGAGTVAVIDTGVDPAHPVLAASLVQGWDFTRDMPEGSETADLNQEVTPILDQEVTPILDSGGRVILNQEVTPILDQEVTPILDGRLPAAFGHGTMTSGVIHLIAPTARIMPLKAFRSNGAGNVSDVIEAIYWAVQHGANVINMSFDSPVSSEELMKAIAFANASRVICVAAAGNDGSNITVYPAGYAGVIAVASTSNTDQRSSFSNYGGPVALAAPGEAIVSTYPRNRYAMGWGTSFSAPMVSGAVALMLQLDPTMTRAEIGAALSRTWIISAEGMGAGRLDLVRALGYASTH